MSARVHRLQQYNERMHENFKKDPRNPFNQVSLDCESAGFNLQSSRAEQALLCVHDYRQRDQGRQGRRIASQEG